MLDHNEPVADFTLARVLPLVESPQVAQDHAEELFAALACQDDEAMTGHFVESDVMMLAERHGTKAAMDLLERISDRLCVMEAQWAKELAEWAIDDLGAVLAMMF